MVWITLFTKISEPTILCSRFLNTQIMPKDLTVFNPKLKIINLILLGVVALSMITNGWFMGETKEKLA